MTILNEIQQNYNRLPNKEKQIAKYILEKVMNSRILILKS